MRWTMMAAMACCGLLVVRGAQAASLYDDLGQKPGLVRLVDTAASLWLADPRVRDTFSDTNMPRFKRLLTDQLCALSGGGCTYAGRSMEAAHKGLHIRTEQFNAVAEDLQAAMDAQNIPFSVQNRLVALLAPMHREMVK